MRGFLANGMGMEDDVEKQRRDETIVQGSLVPLSKIVCQRKKVRDDGVMSVEETGC